MHNVNEVPANLKQKSGHQTITDLSSVTQLTVPEGAEYALISVEGADVRWTDDGTTPTASVGHLIDVSVVGSQPFFYRYGKLANVRLLETGTAAVVQVSYYAKPGN